MTVDCQSAAHPFTPHSTASIRGPVTTRRPHGWTIGSRCPSTCRPASSGEPTADACHSPGPRPCSFLCSGRAASFSASGAPSASWLSARPLDVCLR